VTIVFSVAGFNSPIPAARVPQMQGFRASLR
jgi:hypothetical protein